MNTNRKSTPSQEGRQLLETLRQAVAKALERNRRLGQYAVTWQNGKPVVTGEDAPQAGTLGPGVGGDVGMELESRRAAGARVNATEPTGSGTEGDAVAH